MSKRISYFNKQNIPFEISIDDQLRGLDPLDRIHELRFNIYKNKEIYFMALMQATDEFLHYLLRTEENRKKSDYEILLALGLLKVKTAIEKDEAKNISFIFKTTDGPPSYELWVQQLQNEYGWSTAEYIKFNNGKYIIFYGVKHYIPDPITRNALGLRQSQFVPKTQKEINEYKSGKNIDDIKTVKLIRCKDNLDPVFAVFTVPVLEKRHVPNPETLVAIGRTQQQVDICEKKEFDEYPTGKLLAHVDFWDEKPSNGVRQAHVSQKINISGNIGQLNAGEVNKPIASADQSIKTEKLKWWERTGWQILVIIGAIAGIVGLLLYFLVKK